MEDLNHYFQHGYKDDKKRTDRMDVLVRQVIRSIMVVRGDGVPYEIKNGESLRPYYPFSASTVAMIGYVLLKIRNKINMESPIIPQLKWSVYNSLDESIIKTPEGETNNLFDKATESLLNILKNNVKLEVVQDLEWGQVDQLVHSQSFGYNDPFTLSWLSEIILETEPQTELRTNFVNTARARVERAFTKLHEPILFFKKEEGKSLPESSNHIFPLVRTIHLFRTLQQHNEGWEKDSDLMNNLYKLQENLENRVNQQLSYSMVSPNLFDTSEMVMSLEGMLLLEEGFQNINNDLVKKVFEVLVKHQDNSLSWRPLKPFVNMPQGQILLPLSVEIANSLLRICKHLQRKGKYYFYRYFDMFARYFDWLDSEMINIYVKGEDQPYKGWHSEHVSGKKVIHPWETAQVIIFLMNYKSLLQDHIAFQSLSKSGLNNKAMSPKKHAFEDFIEEDSLIGEDEEVQVTQQVKKYFIDSRKIINGEESLFSMLLYGPPGTGKSTIAEELARELGWNLITITPSDFLLTGESDIEANAKNIFQVLEEQKEFVILMDEIDRLLLDRGSKEYKSQAEVFKFMTPSMLVKLKDLRTKSNSIFVIATNYAELIDPAIKRIGRIDVQYLVSPPNKLQRLSIFNKLVAKKTSLITKNNPLTDTDIATALQNTALYAFGEIKHHVDKALRPNTSREDIINDLNKEKRIPSLISLESYAARFVENSPSRSPLKEFFMLVYLMGEVNLEPDTAEKNTIKQALGVVASEFNKHGRLTALEDIVNNKNIAQQLEINLNKWKLIS